MEILRKERSITRRLFTKAKNDFEASLESHIDELTAAFGKLQLRAETLFNVDERIKEQWINTEVMSEEDYFEDCLISDNYQSDWERMKVQYDNAARNDERIKRSHKSNGSDISNNTVKSLKSQHECEKSTCSSACQSRRFRLPKFELRKFDGNTKNWIGFWCQFQKIDGDNTMDDGDKFQYLYQCTVPDSPARELVDSFPPSGANYKKAIEQLKSRFARDDMLIDIYVRELLSLVLAQAKCNTSFKLGHLYDKLNTQLLALQSLGVTIDKYAALLFPLVESALPESVLRAWERSQIHEEKGDEHLNRLMQFLKREAESEERIQLARSGIASGDSLPSVSSQPTAACLVSTEDAVSSAPAEDDKPYLKVNTLKNLFNVGEKKAIFCEGKHLSGDLEWYDPLGEKIPPKSPKAKRIYVEPRPPPAQGPNFLPLMIQSLALEDSGVYTCKAGDLNATINIFVAEKVVIAEPEQNFDAEEGHSVEMPCPAKGTPTPDIQWYKDNIAEPIVNSSKYRITYKSKASTSILKINDLSHMDPGTYRCRATQESISHFTEKICHLRVRHKPVIINSYSEREVYAIMGESKNITCKAVAFPAPTFTWSKHVDNYDEELKSDDEDIQITSSSSNETGTSSVLTLHITNDILDKQYKCTVENPKGRQNFVFHVSVGNKPDPPTAVTVVSATANNITFEVSCENCTFFKEDGMAPRPENLPVLGYVFQVVAHKERFTHPYWINGTTYQFDLPEYYNGTTSHMFTIDNLDKDTEYDVRVATRNLAGYSDWYKVQGFPKTTDGAAVLAKSIGLLILALIVSLTF